MHQSFISLALLIATTLVAGFFAYVHSIKRQVFLLLWTAGWAVFALHYVGPTLAPNSAFTPLQRVNDSERSAAGSSPNWDPAFAPRNGARILPIRGPIGADKTGTIRT